MIWSKRLLFLLVWTLLAVRGAYCADATYEGRPASYWKEHARDADERQRQKALEAMKGLGDIPELKLLLRDQNPDVRVGAAKALGQMGAHGYSRLGKHREDARSR